MSEKLKVLNAPEEKNRRNFIRTFAGLFAGLTLFGSSKKVAKSNQPGSLTMFGPEAYLGAIAMFGGNYAPKDWAFCHGQLLNIVDNQALFAVIGNYYGGDGRVTFGLPDFRGRVPISFGAGPGLSNYPIGYKGGTERVSLTNAELPSHSHAVKCDTQTTSASPVGTVPGQSRNAQYSTNLTGNMNQNMIEPTGSGQAHYNIQPYQTVNFIMCVNGLFPPRN